MKSTIIIATSLALALSATSALAGGKKAPAAPADPRAAYFTASAKADRPNGRQNWCDMDPKCNGWDKTYELVGQKKMKVDYRPNEMKL
jgi:hypothetical protein